MANLPPDSNSDTGTRSSRRTAPGMPRWVKVSGVVVIGVVLLVVVLHVTGNSFAHHAPSIEYWLQQR